MSARVLVPAVGPSRRRPAATDAVTKTVEREEQRAGPHGAGRRVRTPQSLPSSRLGRADPGTGCRIYATRGGPTETRARFSHRANPIPESQQCLDSDYLEMVREYGVVGNPTGTIAWGRRSATKCRTGSRRWSCRSKSSETPRISLTREQANAVVDAAMMNYCGISCRSTVQGS
jgi:hypothetical protein